MEETELPQLSHYDAAHLVSFSYPPPKTATFGGRGGWPASALTVARSKGPLLCQKFKGFGYTVVQSGHAGPIVCAKAQRVNKCTLCDKVVSETPSFAGMRLIETMYESGPRTSGCFVSVRRATS